MTSDKDIAGDVIHAPYHAADTERDILTFLASYPDYIFRSPLTRFVYLQFLLQNFNVIRGKDMIKKESISSFLPQQG